MLIDLKPLIAASWLAIFFLAGSLLIGGRAVLIPFALAVLIWQLINAIASRYQKVWLLGRSASNWLRLTMGVITIILAMTVVVNLIVSNVGSVSAAAPSLEANLIELLPRLADSLGLPHPPNTAQLFAEIDLDVWIRNLSATMAGLASNIGLVALYVAFMLFEQESYDRKIRALFPDQAKADAVRQLLGHIERSIERYLWVKTLFSIAIAFLSWCVLTAVGCQNAGFWGLVIFMLNYIPVVGSFLGVAMPAMLVLVQFGDLGPFFVVVVSLAVIQFSLGTVLEPKLMGSSLNLSPVVIVLSLAIWGSVWGIAGMFLCVPIMVIIVIVCAHFEPTRPLAILLSGTGDIGRGVVDPAQTTP